MLGASRSAATDRRGQSAGRAYPAVHAGDDVEAMSAQLAATRALLVVSRPDDVTAVVATLVRDLGGALVPARLDEAGAAMPVDVSFGLTEPMLPWADPVSVSAMRLSLYLPDFLADARTVFDRLQGDARRREEAERDSLTGLLTRRAWMRRLSEAGPHDAVALIDLDHFKAANDAAGHAAGDEVLRAVGGLLQGSLRPDDCCGRYGGDEMACLTTFMTAEALATRMDRLRDRWRQQRPPSGAGVGLSIGVARIDGHEPRTALEAADRALYRVKTSGRDATAIAAADDYRARPD